MFEQEINDTIQRITRDVLQERTVIPLTELIEEPRIPDRFKAFFETEAHWWIFTESVARARDRRFDFSHPELGSLLNYLEQVQVRHARFERDDFTAVLDSAVKLTYNYLCRPQTTLKWYIFRGEPTKSIGETLLRMDAFVDYPYFRTVFGEWVERKKSERPTFDSISAKEFERIIRRIDDQILLSCTIEDLLSLMDPLFDFIGKGEAKSIPIEALIVFFDDKNIRKLVDFLERERRHRSHVTHNSFAILMEELLSSSDDTPDTDFSSVYQDDALDEVVREHLGWGSGTVEDDAARITRAAEAVSDGYDGAPQAAEVSAADVVGTSDDEEGLEDDRWEEEALLTPVDVSRAVDEISLVEGVPADPAAAPEFPVRSAESLASEAVAAKIVETDSGEQSDDTGEDLFGEIEAGVGDPIFDLLIEPGDVEQVKFALKLSSDVTDRAEEDREVKRESSPVADLPASAAAQEDEPREFRIAAIPEEEDLMEAILRDEEREPQGTAMETPLIFDVEEFGAADEVGDGGVEDVLNEEKEAFEEEPVAGDVDDEEWEQHAIEEVDEGDDMPDRGDGNVAAEAAEQPEEEPAEEETAAAEESDFALVDEPVRSAGETGGEVEEENEAEDEEPSKSGPEDVRNYIDAMLERKVVKRIFNRDRDSYEETLNHLNDAETWREASRILDELFIRYDVDPYSRIAIRFTDCVYGRYLSPVQ